MEKNIRKIKLDRKLRFLQRGWTSSQSTIQTVPWLSISGLWLDKAGFHAGNQVEIEVKQNQLIIKKVTSHGTN